MFVFFFASDLNRFHIISFQHVLYMFVQKVQFFLSFFVFSFFWKMYVFCVFLFCENSFFFLISSFCDFFDVYQMLFLSSF